ncbi:MAG: hypothetical protein AB9883_01475 [Acidaminococcaceae bacterium]
MVHRNSSILADFNYTYVKCTRDEDATGLLHISDRLLADESSRVEAARGALYPLRICKQLSFLVPDIFILHLCKLFLIIMVGDEDETGIVI